MSRRPTPTRRRPRRTAPACCVEKLLPQRAARRLFTEHNAALVLFGAASVGLAFGLARSPTRGGRLAALVAATAAGTVFYQLGRSQLGRSS